MKNCNRVEDGLKPSARKVLGLLRDAGDRGVTTGEFIREYISRFGGRLHELRAAGFSIETERIGQGQSRYVLRDEPVGLGAGVGPVASAEPGESCPKSSDAVVGVGGDKTPDDGSLFSLDGEQSSMYDPWSEAA